MTLTPSALTDRADAAMALRCGTALVPRREVMVANTGVSERCGRGGAAAIALSTSILAACAAPATGQPASFVADCCSLRRPDRPFYWLADTAWDLLYATTAADRRDYIRARRAQGFNVALVQLVGGDPRARDREGHTSVTIDAGGHLVADPAFLRSARRQIRELNAAGITVAVVVVWGNNVRAGRLDPASARRFGADVGRVLGGEDVIWLLGGDENPTPQQIPIWLALGEGLRAGSSRPHPMSYHPSSGTASTWFGDQEWLTFDAIQSGHSRYRPQAKSISGMIRAARDQRPQRPVIDLESGYEYIPDGLYRLHPAGAAVAAEDRLDAYDIRARAYLQYVSGAFGYTYGHLDVMKFWSPGRTQKWPGEIAWRTALTALGATQLRVYQMVRRRLGSPYLIPDERIVPPSPRIPDYARTLAGCTPDRKRCLVYSASGVAFTVTSGTLSGPVRYHWIDPRSGRMRVAAPSAVAANVLTFTPPGAPARPPQQGERSTDDWLLAIEPAQGRTRERDAT